VDIPIASSPDIESTLVSRGAHAVTFRDMEGFAQALEQRPIEMLMEEIGSLAQLAEWKFLVARSALRKRLGNETVDRRHQLETAALTLSESAGSDVLRSRIRALVGR